MKERMKQEAIKRMKKLKMMYTPIHEFEKENKLNLSERCGMLYWLDKEQEKMVCDFENEHNALVYHVIHDYTNIGEMYSLLFVSKYEEEWEMDLDDLDNGYALAYVINKDMPDCSEFGNIGVRPSLGGVMRTF